MTVHTQHTDRSSMTMAESTPDTDKAPPAQDFLVFLAGVDKGRVAGELSDGLQKVVEALKNTGKPGSVTLKITVKPAGKSNSDAVIVTGEVAVKAPRAAARESFFFPNADHHLVRSDPNQAELFN